MSDARGSLTVIEEDVPFENKRVYYIYDLIDMPRGGHRHKVTKQALLQQNFL